jgi:hypothetical protein
MFANRVHVDTLGETAIELLTLRTPNNLYVRCKVHRGLFDTEYYVLVTGSSAYYISRDNVKVSKQPQGENSVDGQVRVYLIEKKKDRSLVQLPGEAVVGHLRTWVENSALVNA